MISNMNLAHYYINEYVEEDEISWQLEEIKQKGFDGIILSPAKGLEIGFMSPEWISISYFIFDVCKKLNLYVMLSTESIYPANILETKFNYDVKDYKLHYMTLAYEEKIEGNGVLINNLLAKVNYKSIEDVHIYAIKKKNGKYDLKSFFMIDKYMHEWTTADLDDWHIVIFLEKEANSSYNTLYPFNFFVKNTTLEFLDKIYKKSNLLYKKYKNQFLGFYEPRLIPEVIKDNSFVWYYPIIETIEKDLNLSFFDYLPNIFFDDEKIGYKIREAYTDAMYELYIENFIKVIDSFVDSIDKYTIFKFYNEKRDNLFKDIKSVISIFRFKNYKFSDKAIVSYNIEYDKINRLNVIDAIFVKSAKALGVIKNSIVEITDKYDRFSFTPAKMKKLINYGIVLNETSFIFSSLLYSIKGFRKNDIAPNIFYQSYYWDYMSNVNSHVKSIIKDVSKYEVVKDSFDIGIMIPDEIETTQILIEDNERSFLHGLVDILGKNDKEILFLKSSEVTNLKVRKFGEEKSFVYILNDDSEVFIDNMICLDFKDSKIPKRVEKLSEKKEILTVQFSRDNSSNITIFDVEKIISFLSNSLSSKKVSFENKNKNIVVKHVRDVKRDELIYLIYNMSNSVELIKYSYIYRKKILSSTFQIRPYEILALTLDEIQNIETVKKIKEPKYRIIFKRNWQFKSNKKNIAPLTTWTFKVGGPKDEDVGTIHFYETKFHSNYKPLTLKLILDGVYGERDFKNDSKPVKIFINDVEYSGEYEKLEKSHSLFMMEIGDYVNKGENKIVIKSAGSHFSPITLNEPQFLEGDFVIRKKIENNWLLDKPEKAIINGDWTNNGYPFFYGVGVFEQYFELDDKFDQIFFNIDNNNSPLTIVLNDEHILHVEGPNFRVNITEYVKIGSNRISIEVPSSMANIFTGAKNPEGLIGEASLEIY